MANKLKDKENEIAQALAKKTASEMATERSIEDVMKEEGVEKERMCGYYDIERFDVDYLSDAVVFFESTTAGSRGHAVSVTQPGERRNTLGSARR